MQELPGHFRQPRDSLPAGHTPALDGQLVRLEQDDQLLGREGDHLVHTQPREGHAGDHVLPRLPAARAQEHHRVHRGQHRQRRAPEVSDRDSRDRAQVPQARARAHLRAVPERARQQRHCEPQAPGAGGARHSGRERQRHGAQERRQVHSAARAADPGHDGRPGGRPGVVRAGRDRGRGRGVESDHGRERHGPIGVRARRQDHAAAHTQQCEPDAEQQ